MKIMYYELIKMLIDFERGNKPEAWDSTKNVGKIEGYQVIIKCAGVNMLMIHATGADQQASALPQSPLHA